MRLIDAARASGADAVKFQTFRRISRDPRRHKAPYQERTDRKWGSQFDMLRRLELDAAAHRRLMAYCGNRNSVPVEPI